MFSVIHLEGGLGKIETPDGTVLSVPRENLPDGVREGDLLMPQDGGGWKIDEKATLARRAALRRKLNRLWE